MAEAFLDAYGGRTHGLVSALLGEERAERMYFHAYVILWIQASHLVGYPKRDVYALLFVGRWVRRKGNSSGAHIWAPLPRECGFCYAVSIALLPLCTRGSGRGRSAAC